MMLPSFWEQDAMLDADVIVVGAGLVGLQTALEVRARLPHARIRVLERGALPCGASTRNAGFACFGSLTELLHDCDTMGESATAALVERRWQGLRRLRARVGDAALGYEQRGGFELLREEELAALDSLDKVNALLRPVFGQDVFYADTAAPARCGFGAQVRVLVGNSLEGQLHTGMLMQALIRLAAQQDISLLAGVRVVSLEEGDGEVRVHAAAPAPLTLRAARVALCTNGFTQELLPECGIVPARGQVLVTEPVPGLPWHGTYHLERGFYYFRNIGERVLLGGARHLHMAAEATSELAVTAPVQKALERLLKEVILPGRNPPIAQRWAGIMGFTADKQPLVRRVSERIVLGFGCNGMGVALGADIAGRTAALLT